MASLEERAAKWLSQNPDIEAKEDDVLKSEHLVPLCDAMGNQLHNPETGGPLFQYVGTSEQSQTNRGDCACECEDCIIEGEEDYCCGFTKQDATNPAHYAILDPQPWDVITAWNLGYLDGSVIKYISRWRNKNGLEDLKKARAFLGHLISIEEAK